MDSVRWASSLSFRRVKHIRTAIAYHNEPFRAVAVQIEQERFRDED